MLKIVCQDLFILGFISNCISLKRTSSGKHSITTVEHCWRFWHYQSV